MTAKQFQAAIRQLNVSGNKAGAILGISRASVFNYLNGHAEVPLYVERLVELLLKHGVPRGWRA